MCHLKGFVDGGWAVDYIGVGEEEPVSFGLAGTEPDGVVFANPTRWQGGGEEEAELGIG